ncbi:MAG TPA: PgaD family protein [Thermodesulfovibrionales bacterium]|nr:PgaD family protein [Thermodesulfovibrionales bacterium]
MFTIEIIEQTGYLEFLALVRALGWYVLILFSILRLWGYYNYWKFGKRNRRKASMSDDAATQELADYFQLQIPAVHELRGLKEVLWPVEGHRLVVKQIRRYPSTSRNAEISGLTW